MITNKFQFTSNIIKTITVIDFIANQGQGASKQPRERADKQQQERKRGTRISGAR